MKAAELAHYLAQKCEHMTEDGWHTNACHDCELTQPCVGDWTEIDAGTKGECLMCTRKQNCPCWNGGKE